MEKKKNRAHDVFCVIVYVIAIAFLLANMIACGAAKPTVVVKDSVRVEIHERIVHDTAYFALQPSEQAVMTKDTASHLENEYAQTDAAIRGGLLFHSLVTTPKTINVPVITIVHDTLMIEAKENTVYVDVPRQPTKWENFLEICGYILLVIVFLFSCYVVLRIILRR